MSQSIPNRAVISETTMIPAGIAAHAGSPDTRSENRADRPSSATFPLRWPSPEPHQHDGDEPGGAGRDRDLVQRGAAGGLGLGEEFEHAERMYRRLTSRSVTSDTLERVLTIDELARETGLTVRNVRSHHARGLLQPPEVRGRTGYYGPEHVERLRLIQQLQGEGMKLSGIKRLLGDVRRAPAGAQGGVAGGAETPEVVTAPVLARAPAADREDDPKKLITKATKLGLLHPLGEGQFEVPSPALLAAAEEVVARGVSLDHALDDARQRRSPRPRGLARSS